MIHHNTSDIIAKAQDEIDRVWRCKGPRAIGWYRVENWVTGNHGASDIEDLVSLPHSKLTRLINKIEESFTIIYVKTMFNWLNLLTPLEQSFTTGGCDFSAHGTVAQKMALPVGEDGDWSSRAQQEEISRWELPDVGS